MCLLKKNYFFIVVFLIVSCSSENLEKNAITAPIPKTGKLVFKSLELVKEKLVFHTYAIGRETVKGSNNGPRIELTNKGLAHPSVIYIPQGIDGYSYWCALTPYFGPINLQKDNNAFENPHIFCSIDGLNWKEPDDINNPIDNSVLPYGNYWSDTNLLYYNGKLHLYYRGNYFDKNFFGTNMMYYRSVVERNSTNGREWSERKLLYASNSFVNGIDNNSVIASPSFIVENDHFYCYDVVLSTKDNPYLSIGNQTSTFVFRREDNQPDGTFGAYSSDKICTFDSRPWGETDDPWHIEVVKHEETYFMLINSGLIGSSFANSLWLAYSQDGKNFKVLPTALFRYSTYKSSILPISSDADNISFMIYQSDTSDGSINAYQLALKKN
jgi:hypothetical protein